MTLSADDIDKMKVADLKAELSARGLDTKGLKKDLAERLKAAVESEGAEAPASNDDESNQGVSNEEPQESANDTADMQEQEQNGNDKEEVEEKTEEQAEEKSMEQGEENLTEQTEENHEEPAPVMETTDQPAEEVSSKADGEDAEMSTLSEPQEADSKEEHPDDSTAAVYGGKDETMAELDETIKAESEEKPKEETAEVKQEEAEVKQEEAEVKKDEATEEKKTEESPAKQEKGVKRKREEQALVFDTVPLDEPEIDKDALVLDWYNSDLHLQIDRESLTKASPMSNGGFAYMWAGARSTFGIRRGKVAFEVKLTGENDTKHLVNETDPHVLRVGFSTDDNSMQLGEEPTSYGYGGTGKKSVDLKFSNYGVAFGLNDVIGAYLEMNEEFASISYTKNGEDLGEAFRVTVSELGDKALFPHILTKNYQFECNFGQLAEPWFQLKDGFTFINQVPIEERVRGCEPPASRNECEMIMLIGLPGSGKTTWASKYAQEHPEKKYNILGTNALIDKMKVAGLNRKRNYAGRWDQLIQKCTDCLNRLLVLAAKRRRNYILDQTNVYPSARRRKLKCYGDFIRRAVVIVPAEEEFKRRVAKREAEEGKDVPDEAVLEMKANFRLPENGPLFASIEYPELDAEEAAKLVQQYNEEGTKAGYGPNQKKPRMEDRRQSGPMDKRGPPAPDRRRDHRRVDTWGGRNERDNRPSRFDDRRGPRDRRSFEGPPRREPGFGGRMPPGPPAGRFGGYAGYGGPSPRGGPPPRRGHFVERERGYGGADYYRGGGEDYYRGGAGDYARGGGGDYPRGGAGDYSRGGAGDYSRGGAGDYSRGGAGDFSRGGAGDYSRGGHGGYGRGGGSTSDVRRGGPDRRGPSGDRRTSAGNAPRQPARPRETPRQSAWEQQPAQQQQTWTQPAAQTQAATPAQWGQPQTWSQAGYSYDPNTYAQQYQQGYWNGQSYDYSAAWQQQQQMYYQQAAGQGSATGAGAQATQQGTWKSY